jgi:hypothetical protein
MGNPKLIIRSDYLSRLDPGAADLLAGELDEDDKILDQIEEEVEEEIKALIGHRFDLDSLFGKTIRLFDTGTIYGDNVFVYVAPTVAFEDFSGTIPVNTYFNDKPLAYDHVPVVYRTIVANATTSDNLDDETKFVRVGKWGDIFQSLAPAPPNELENQSAWSNTDPRDRLLISKMVPIIIGRLFERLSPRQIPEHRQIAAEDAMNFITTAGDPRGNILPSTWPLQSFDEGEGLDISFGSGRVEDTHEFY